VDGAPSRPPCARARTGAQGALCNILNEQEIKPHKVRHCLERRDPELAPDERDLMERN
jgi:hypothetical protein